MDLSNDSVETGPLNFLHKNEQKSNADGERGTFVLVLGTIITPLVFITVVLAIVFAIIRSVWGLYKGREGRVHGDVAGQHPIAAFGAQVPLVPPPPPGIDSLILPSLENKKKINKTASEKSSIIQE